MITNAFGRVKNTSLPKAQSLLPLFEAIANSIDSIQDADISDGSIQIEILRQQTILADGRRSRIRWT